MKKLLFYFYLISCLSNGQNNDSNKNFKKIIETETYGVMYSDGKKHIFTSEINEYNYDTLGREMFSIRKTFYNRKPYNTIRTNFFYRDDDRIDYSESHILEDSLSFKTDYTYQKDKLCKKDFLYKTENSLIQFNENYFYNNDGELEKINYLYSEQDLYTEVFNREIAAEFQYDKKERMIESDWTKSDSTYKYNRIVHLRNRKGLRKKDKEYNKNDELIKTVYFKYVFDDKNNWIIQKHYEKRELIRAVYREIEYYENPKETLAN